MPSFIYDLSDTWNDSGTTFNAIKMNVTDTASLADSKLLDLQISGISKFNVSKTGEFFSLSGNVLGNLNVGTLISNTISGTLTTSSQPNITSVGTLTSLDVSGNINATNITANTGVFTGNGSALTALNASNISSGTLDQARLANSNVVLGNTTLALGTTTTTITGLTSVTSTTFVGALTGAATTAGTVTVNAQPNITSVGTLTGLAVNGNITAANITANTGVFTGNGSGLNSIAGANVTGQVANALVSGTVYSSSQPNITSVGTLTSLGVSGNVTSGNIVTGSGSGGSIVGANLISSNFFVGTILTTTQPNITSLGTLTSLTVSGNASVGNLSTSGTVAATGNITGGNLSTSGTVAATGNITGGNLSTSGIVTATGNISGNNIVSGNTLTAGDTLILNTDYTEKLFTQTGTDFTINLSNGTIQKLVTAGNTTITLPASVIGKSYMIIVEYGGAHGLTWAGGTNIKWAGNLIPVPTSTLGRIDIFTFFCDGVNTYAGVFGQNF